MACKIPDDCTPPRLPPDGADDYTLPQVFRKSQRHPVDSGEDPARIIDRQEQRLRNP